MPDRCPVCGEPVVQPEGEVAYYCTNSSCPAQLVRGVEHFVGRGAMDIDGFGIKQAELFVELGYITDLADIYYPALGARSRHWMATARSGWPTCAAPWSSQRNGRWRAC